MGIVHLQAISQITSCVVFQHLLYLPCILSTSTTYVGTYVWWLCLITPLYTFSEIVTNEPILLFFSPIFLSGVSFFLAFYAQHFAQSYNIMLKAVLVCSKFICIASYLTVTSYTYTYK